MTSRSAKRKTRSGSTNARRALVVVRCGARGLACFPFIHYTVCAAPLVVSLAPLPFRHRALPLSPSCCFSLTVVTSQTIFLLAQTYFLFSSLPFFVVCLIQAIRTTTPKENIHYFASMLSEIKAQLDI